MVLLHSQKNKKLDTFFYTKELLYTINNIIYKYYITVQVYEYM